MWLQVLKPAAQKSMPDGVFLDHVARGWAWVSLLEAAVYISTGNRFMIVLGGLFWFLSVVAVTMSVGGHDRDTIRRAYFRNTT